MPMIIELRLKASWAVQPDTRKLHGLACALFGHDPTFTIWPLQAAAGSDHDWTFRGAWLPATLPPASALEPESLRHGHVTCAVVEAQHRRVSHAQIAAGVPMRAVRVQFSSPAYFAQNGASTALPDPRLIAGSWRRRWDASLPAGDPLAISDDTWRDTHRALSLAEYDLHTERRDSGYDRDQAGMVGWLVIRAAGSSGASRVLGTLARFAEFCGTGAQATHGFGATTVTPLPMTPDG